MPNAPARPRSAGPSKPGSKPAGAPGAPKKPGLPGQPGQQPGDEWGEDNPGNVHGVGVDDHVFFHRDGAGPAAGKVVAHGVHGCQVADDAGARHKVRWSRVLALKQRAVLPAKVVDRGDGGSIVEHPDGRRVFVAGELPLPADAARFQDVAGLEDASRASGDRRPKLAELEDFARSGADLAKALTDHECEGPALCRVCAQRRHVMAVEDLGKSLVPGIAAALQALEQRAVALRRPRSAGAGSSPRRGR